MTGDNLDLFTVGLVLMALASLIVSRHEIAAAWARGSRVQAMAAQVLVTGGMLSAATFVENKLLTQIVTLTVFMGLLLVAGIGAKQTNQPGASWANTPPVLTLLVLWAWSYSVNLFMVPDELFDHAVVRIGSGLALLAFLIAQSQSPITPLHFFSASLTTIVGIVVFLPTSPQWYSGCGRFKCNGIDAILQGPFESGNLLGLSATMCATLLLIASADSFRSFRVVICLLPILYATMSRTSLLAISVAFALFTADHFMGRGRIRRPISGFVATTTALASSLLPLAIGMFLVFRSSADAFSERGAVWAKGRDAVWGFVVTGRGVDWWQVLADTSYFGSGFEKFTHSEYLLIYFAGGLVALSLFGVALFRITYTSVCIENSVGRGAVVPLTFAVCGMVETIWNPLTIDAGTWIFFAVTSVAYPRLSVGHRTGDAAEQRSRVYMEGRA